MFKAVRVDGDGNPIQENRPLRATQVEGQIPSPTEGLNPSLKKIENAANFRIPIIVTVQQGDKKYSISGTPTMVTKVGKGAIVGFDTTKDLRTDLPELEAASAFPGERRFFNLHDHESGRAIPFYLNSNEVALDVDQYSLQIAEVKTTS